MTTTRYVLACWLCLSVPGLAGEDGEVEAPLAEEAAVQALGSNVVARIGDFDVPYEWFAHEFRSTFFRYAGATNLRETVFSPFMERMTLYALARQAGIPGQGDLRARIAERVSGMRAFMEYQLAMIEVGMVVEAYLSSRGLTPSAVTVSDEDLQNFFETRIKGQPGAPASLEDVPAGLQRQIRENLAMEIFTRQVSQALVEWKTNLPATVNRPLIEAVPLPEMEGAPPEFAPQGPSSSPP